MGSSLLKLPPRLPQAAAGQMPCTFIICFSSFALFREAPATPETSRYNARMQKIFAHALTGIKLDFIPKRDTDRLPLNYIRFLFFGFHY
jgi:hypothetical protein